MKKFFGFSLILLILLLTFSQSATSVTVAETKENYYLLKSTVQYSNPSLTNVWNFTQREEDRTVNLFMNTSWQTVKLLNSTFPVETVKNDSDGNSIAVLQFPQTELSSGQNLSFLVWYQITTRPRTIPNIAENESENLDNIEPDLVSDYTRKEGPWQTDNAGLRQLAFNLKENETRVLSIVKSFISWIKNHIVYPKTSHEVPYYPSETYSNLEGDCDDQAMLLVTLCRIVGIPAYLQVGAIYLPSRTREEDSYWNNHVTVVQKHIGWHGWAIVYIPPWGWLPVDLTYVLKTPNDPLSAIKYGAITEPTAVQYENVTHSDYVASSHEARDFIIRYGFEVFAEDEMFLGTSQQPQQVLNVPSINWVTVALAAVVVALLVGAFFFVVRKWTKQ